MTVYELCDLILNIETNVQIFKYSEGENVFDGTADNAMNAFYANDIVTNKTVSRWENGKKIPYGNVCHKAHEQKDRHEYAGCSQIRLQEYYAHRQKQYADAL